MISVSTTYALKSLFRHTRRTLLSVVGVAIGCASSLITIAFVRGEGEMFMRSVAETGNGHLRVAPDGWARVRDDDMRVAHWKEELAKLRANDGVKVAAPRSHITALLGAGIRTVGTQIAGVDPVAEPQVNRLVRGVMQQGRYLAPGDAGQPEVPVVVGQAVVDRLEIELDDLIVATAAGVTDELNQVMLRVVGIVSTQSAEIDLTICHVPLADFERICGQPGAGEISVLLKDHRLVQEYRDTLAASACEGNEVITWAEVAPAIADGVKIDESFTDLTVVIVIFLVFLGITSAQLTAVLERRREFAVLSAVGMRGTGLVRIMFIEGVIVGIAGAAFGLVLSTPLIYWLAATGLRFFPESTVTAGVLLDSVLYADIGAWLIPYGLAISLTATVLASLYPAWYAARTDPAAALRSA